MTKEIFYSFSWAFSPFSWPPFNSCCSSCTYHVRDVTGNHSWLCLSAMFGKFSCRPPSSLAEAWHFNHARLYVLLTLQVVVTPPCQAKKQPSALLHTLSSWPRCWVLCFLWEKQGISTDTWFSFSMYHWHWGLWCCWKELIILKTSKTPTLLLSRTTASV